MDVFENSEMDEPKTTNSKLNDKIKVEVPAVDEDVKENNSGVIVSKKHTEDKGRKKGDKCVEQVLKTLSSLGTSEEKLAAVCKKYADIVDENKKLQAQIKQSDKKALVFQREKEQLQAEQNKAILTRSRLESLCRELQKQNKQIKDESLQRVKEEEEKRKAVSGKFQATLTEITTLMQQNNENNSRLRDENLEMQNKFKAVCEQYEIREQQVGKMYEQMQLESQLAEAKLTKLKFEMNAEKELIENEKKMLLNELTEYQNKYLELQKKEGDLNVQINMYSEMYYAFQNAMAETTTLYDGLQKEMNKMSGKVAKLEQETSLWKMRWEDSHKALLKVTAEKHEKMSELDLAKKQLAQLQKLCRKLQADRTSLLTQLKSEGLIPKLSVDDGSEDDLPGNNSESSAVEKSEIVDTNKGSCDTEKQVQSDKNNEVETSVKSDEMNSNEVETSAKVDEINSKEVDEISVQVEKINSMTECNGKEKDEVIKAESNSKVKKGKGGSKKRKK